MDISYAGKVLYFLSHVRRAFSVADHMIFNQPCSLNGVVTIYIIQTHFECPLFAVVLTQLRFSKSHYCGKYNKYSPIWLEIFF